MGGRSKREGEKAKEGKEERKEDDSEDKGRREQEERKDVERLGSGTIRKNKQLLV